MPVFQQQFASSRWPAADRRRVGTYNCGVDVRLLAVAGRPPDVHTKSGLFVQFEAEMKYIITARLLWGPICRTRYTLCFPSSQWTPRDRCKRTRHWRQYQQFLAGLASAEQRRTVLPQPFSGTGDKTERMSSSFLPSFVIKLCFEVDFSSFQNAFSSAIQAI